MLNRQMCVCVYMCVCMCVCLFVCVFVCMHVEPIMVCVWRGEGLCVSWVSCVAGTGKYDAVQNAVDKLHMQAFQI